ncbi:hypothetical protein HMF8227_01453 [Saliniradius amylolyticus]|uniref:Uncharacterized protein n=1 Tax=Saliniradius amylolyticus TaxID=2183582 RepID=A0A2S2E2Q5_9ALTE|nr:hypothetical protein [Saliniradius amylolyticus]AWL11928.1 hypothetical protein HMF8227_01453 [Saliniradius amylolyticus]
MPFLFWPLIAGGAGFGLGLFSSDTFGSAIKWAVIGGAVYVAYKQVSK